MSARSLKTWSRPSGSRAAATASAYTGWGLKLTQLDHDAVGLVVVFQLVSNAWSKVTAKSWSRLSERGAAVTTRI
jgi:hypothetical protein